MEDGDGGDLTPFWVQSTANVRRVDRFRRRVSAVFFSSGLVVFLLLVTAVLFLVFVVPSSISFSAQIFKPNSVKRSWDSLNIVLVLVAVVFGFLSRNEEKYSYYDESQKLSNPSTPNRSCKYNYATIEGPKSNISNSILTRNSSSYPDLREFSNTHGSYGDYYYDDIHVDSGRVWDSDLDLDPVQGQLHRRHRSLGGAEHLIAPVQNKTVIFDTLLSKYKEAAYFPTPEKTGEAAGEAPPEIEENPKMSMSESETTRSENPSTRMNKDLDPITAQMPPQPPPAAADPPEITENTKLTYERMGRKKERSSRKRNKDVETKGPTSSPPSPPLQKSTDRKRSGATGSSTKDFLNSLYHKKNKKQRQKSVDNLDLLLHQAPAPLSFQLPLPTPPPPPPHPPPPSSAFQNLFSTKKQKRKRTITVTLAPQTPSPPQPQPQPAAAREPEPTSQTAPSITHRSPRPINMNSSDKLEEISNSGGESPLNRIPPPPPPPPPGFFKSSAWNFVVQGDYVRVNSITSSRSGSPDTDDGESDVTPSAVDSGENSPFHPSPLLFPSPDVNTKAESFITNFRAKLKLETIHSMKKREVGLSGLGPGPGPSQFSQGN